MIPFCIRSAFSLKDDKIKQWTFQYEYELLIPKTTKFIKFLEKNKFCKFLYATVNNSKQQQNLFKKILKKFDIGNKVFAHVFTQ